VGKARAIIPSLLRAVALLSPRPHCLSPAHPDLLQACITGEAYSFAQEFLKTQDIFEVNLKETNLVPEDFLRYFYNAGVCCIASGQWAAAMEYLDQCISAPANVLSPTVSSAIKKAKLVSLVLNGRSMVVSSTTSSVVVRFCKTKLETYDCIVKAFETSPQELARVLAQESDALVRDGNLALAKMAVDALTRHRIRRLALTYLTLSLEQIALKADLSECDVEGCILKLVVAGEVKAKIDGNSKIVTFLDDGTLGGESRGETGSSSAEEVLAAQRVAMRVEGYLQQTTELSQRLRDMHQSVLTSASYLSKSSGRSMGLGGMGMSTVNYSMEY